MRSKKHGPIFMLCAALLLVLMAGCNFSNPAPVPLQEENNMPKEPDSVTALVGFAATGEGTTGGAGGQAVTLTTLNDLLQHIDGEEPAILLISGAIDLEQRVVQVGSNKTLLGIGADARLMKGGLQLTGSKNVIIRNITFADSGGDAIDIQEGSEYIWIDHNTFTNAADGLVDIKKWSNYVTVSWNHFYNHDKTSLVGHSDTVGTDYDKLKVTYHHNWFDGTNQRHPRVRFGEVHVYNNYYSHIGSYGIAYGVGARVYSENNYFENVQKPISPADKPSEPGYIKDVGSYFAGDSVEPEWKPEGIAWEPKNYYKYYADPAVDVKQKVMNEAGAGKLNIEIKQP